MKKTKVLLLLIIFLCFTGCEDKESDKKPLFVENTTEVFTEKDKQLQTKRQINITQESEATTIPSTNTQPYTDTFTLTNAKKINHKLTLSNNKLTLKNIQASIVLINPSLFGPCVPAHPFHPLT